MRRRIIIPVTLYLTAALGSRAAEAAGFQQCHCSAACWCRKPLLGAFRWVLPIGHRYPGHESRKHATPIAPAAH